MTLANCPVDSDFYAGQNCKDNPCVVGAKSRSLYGVCCDNNGFCDITTEEGCDCRNGTWKGNDFDCLSYDCCAGSTAALQACCMGSYIKGSSGDYSWAGLCKDLKPCECLEVGGVPRGPLSTCSEINGVGGCGVTGATAYGSCCTTGNCLSPDDKGYPNGYTAGDCAVLGGLWGGSGSACNDGTTFSNSWPCSWPTGSCCFGHHPFNGVTYCDSGKTCGDCLNQPPGGSGGMAWVGGATCGTLKDINGISCITPSGLDSGTCCIPEYFGVEDADTEAFVVDYKCYVTSENRCIGLGGLWNNEKSSCDDIECCSQYGDCTFGDSGACCQFNISGGEFIQCDSTTIYHCEQIASNNKNITTLFHKGEDCNEETGYPCKDSIFTTDSCCLWQQDGAYIGCQNIGENDPCPPTDVYIGVRFDQPCESPGFNCAVQEMGACCHGSMCSFTSRGQCIKLEGIFYEELNCLNDCDVLPCCSSVTDPVITGYNKHNESISRHGADGCLDSFSVSSHTDKEFASDYLIDLGVNNPDAVRSLSNQEFDSCEDCNCPFSRSRGSCCLGTACVPNYTQDECIALGGTFLGCSGKPFENISQSWMTDNPCLEMGCAEQSLLGEEDCGESEGDCIGACCSGGGEDFPCPPGGSCNQTTEAECGVGCFYGCDTTCCSEIDQIALACCLASGSCEDFTDINGSASAIEQCASAGGIHQGYGTECGNLHESACEVVGGNPIYKACCLSNDNCTVATELECSWMGGCWRNNDNECVSEGGSLVTCQDLSSCGEVGPGYMWGSCCKSDGSCVEMTNYQQALYDSVNCPQCEGLCQGGGDIFVVGQHCIGGCGLQCVANDCSDPCPDCRPCCIQEGGEAAPEELTGRYLCEDMLPSECEDIGGTPQCSGTKCSDTGVTIDGAVYNQGQLYCNWCGYKAHEFTAEGPEGGNLGATNLGGVCRACCECDKTRCDCYELPTYQDFSDVELDYSCGDSADDWGICYVNTISYLDDDDNTIPDNDGRPCGRHSHEWCTECECSPLGACCMGSVDTDGSGEDCLAGTHGGDDPTPHCISGLTREDCYDVGCGSHTCRQPVWMGPGSVCSLHPDDADFGRDYGAYCNANIAPCCYCDKWTEQDHGYIPYPESWCTECDMDDENGEDECIDTAGDDNNCNYDSECNCCSTGKGPGATPPPWTGTKCKLLSKYDIDNGECKNNSEHPGGTEGYVGKFGESCSSEAYGGHGAAAGGCDSCDDGTLGRGACCSCHAAAHNFPWGSGGAPPWGNGNSCSMWFDSENYECAGNPNDEWPGGGSAICFGGTNNKGVSKLACDKKNLDGAFGTIPWDGSQYTLWAYPELNSGAGVHPIANMPWRESETLGTASTQYTWWGPNSSCDPEWMGHFSAYENKPCAYAQLCSESVIADLPERYSPRLMNPFAWCHMEEAWKGPCFGGSCTVDDGIFGGGDGYPCPKLTREWSTPFCLPTDTEEECRHWGLLGNNIKGHEYENIGTPLKQGGYCDDHPNPELCGTGCPLCRSGAWMPIWSMIGDGGNTVVSLGNGWSERDCKRGCKTFGCCCNPIWGTVTRWPEHECTLLGGLYLGDFPCSVFGCPCGDQGVHGPGGPASILPWRPSCQCSICAAQTNLKGRIYDDKNIKYELLLTGREDTNNNQISIPFFGFVDVETPPIDIQEDALIPNDSILHWKISGNRPENALMTDIPFPTDPTTYQYLQGYYDVDKQNNQNKFYWGASDANDFVSYKNNIKNLWLTRKYQTPENVELSNTFEPYYHSKVEFSQIPNLEKFVINPARYGNGRNEFGEELEWGSCTDMVGYYIGLYLSKDMSISGNKGSKIKTLIANDSSIDSVCTPMQYFNSSILNDLEVLHVSNNELYRLSIGNNNKIKEIRAENNKLGHTTGTSWINAEGYPDTQEHFPMYRLSKIQRLILSKNDIKSLDTQSVKFNRLTSLIASNNPNLNNSKKLELNAPLLEYLDLSECGLGGGILLQNVPNIKQIILRDATQLGNTEDSFHFVLGKNTLPTNLQALVLTNSRIRFLNLGASSQREWGDSGVVGIYNECGSEFLNLKYIDLSNNKRLSKVELPKPSHSYSNSNKEYIEYLNVNGTSIGENVDEFFSQSAFIPNSYPKGHRLEVSARNITNLSGDKITLSLDKYNEIVNLWDGSEKFIILDVDIDK
jgi:hypothetical protein